MRFNYFRILVTILASFSAFFAYVCRLNLSLTIEDMTIKPIRLSETTQTDSIGTSTNLPSNEQDNTIRSQRTINDMNNLKEKFLSYKHSSIYNEEHSFALITRRTCKLPQPKAILKQVELRSPKKSILLRGFDVNAKLLSVDVEKDATSGGLSTPSSTKDNNNLDTSNAAVTNNNQDGEQVLIEPAQSNLLEWDESAKNDILGSFFYGYVLLLIPSARAAEMFGAKSLLLISGFGTGLCSLVFPYAAKYSSSIIPPQIVRIIMGASQGALFPVGYVFICAWLPKSERSFWLPFPSAFSRIGTIAMYLFVPFVIRNYDWETVFYISGIVTLAWCALFLILASDYPTKSYWISKQELTYIESQMNSDISGNQMKQSELSASGFTINEPSPEHDQQQSNSIGNKPSIDWMAIITSKPIAVLSLTMFVSDWSNFILLVKLPGFLIQVFQMELEEVVNWSCVLVAIFFFTYPLSGFFASKLEQIFSETLSSIQVRKIFEAAAHLFQTTGCLLIAFNNDKTIVIVSLVLMMIGRSIVGGGQCLMPPELSKDYPGTIFAYCNTLANLSGIIGPKLVTWMVANPEEHGAWFNFFIGSAALFALSGVTFCFFAENEHRDYTKDAKLGKQNLALSQAQLTIKEPNPAVEILKMDAFSRIASSPAPKITAVTKTEHPLGPKKFNQ